MFSTSIHYLVKFEIRVFRIILMLEKRNSRHFLLTLILLIEKDATFWLSPHVMAKLIIKICTKPHQNLPHFVEYTTKTFCCVFWFAVLTAVHLLNANAKKFQTQTLSRWGRKGLHFCMTNLLWTICTKFCQNRVRYCRLYIRKHVGVFFQFTV